MTNRDMAVMCLAYGSVSLKGPVLIAALLMRMSIDLVIFLVSSTACYTTLDRVSSQHKQTSDPTIQITALLCDWITPSHHSLNANFARADTHLDLLIISRVQLDDLDVVLLQRLDG
jgi:hypothetical protein